MNGPEPYHVDLRTREYVVSLSPRRESDEASVAVVVYGLSEILLEQQGLS